MLTEKRIKEAEHNVKSYLEDNLMKKSNFENIVYQTYLSNSKESLSVANCLFKKNYSDLWVIVISYYSMFYIACAVVYKHGYKLSYQIPHKVISDALIVYVRPKLKKSLVEEFEKSKNEALSLAGFCTDKLIKYFDFERSKRGYIQYETTTKQKHL